MTNQAERIAAIFEQYKAETMGSLIARLDRAERALERATEDHLDRVEAELGREVKFGEMPQWWREARRTLAAAKGGERR